MIKIAKSGRAKIKKNLLKNIDELVERQVKCLEVAAEKEDLVVTEERYFCVCELFNGYNVMLEYSDFELITENKND